MGLNDLPEDVRNQVKDAFENVNSDGVDTVKSTVVQDMVVEDKAETIPISLDNVLNLVSGLDESLNSGNIEQAEYKRMVTYILQDYITALAPDIRLHFVFTDLMNSELSQYLSDDILKELRESALSSI